MNAKQTYKLDIKSTNIPKLQCDISLPSIIYLDKDLVMEGKAIHGKKSQHRSTYLAVVCGGIVAFLPFSSLTSCLKFPSGRGITSINLVEEYTLDIQTTICQFIQVSQTEQKKASKKTKTSDVAKSLLNLCEDEFKQDQENPYLINSMKATSSNI
jgi:hypothetical protein